MILGVDAILLVLVALVAVAAAFAPNHISINQNHAHDNEIPSRSLPTSTSTSISTTSLMMSPPILIIGPMIRRMRENKERTNLPMANPDESKLEAPGLRVGSNAWKWPPVWPYDTNFFKRKVELEVGSKNRNENAAAGMKGLLTGAAAAGGGMNTSNELEKTENGSNDAEGASLLVFDSLKYWSEQKNVLTELDSRVAEKITKLSYYWMVVPYYYYSFLYRTRLCTLVWMPTTQCFTDYLLSHTHTHFHTHSPPSATPHK